MRASDHRKAIPIGVKLHSALLLLGYTDEQIKTGIQWDHFPAITLRTVNEAGELVPAVNDPRFIRPLLKPEHDIKTFGPGGEKRITSAGGDIHANAHTRRLSKKEAEFRSRVLAKAEGEAPPPTRRKAAIPSRPLRSNPKFPSAKRSQP
ncbi:hypothetical protein AB4099_18795 [Bosea sp. 2KB_26]|uniref:hypothetical protein n=1 Tax=Bosea sp. 2KB_26 TaxID=3237475 RepID=UPI003F934BE4